MKRSLSPVIGFAVVAAVMLAAGCAANETDPSAPGKGGNDEGEGMKLTELLRSRDDVGFVSHADSIGDVLPGADGATSDATTAVVVGDIADVEPGTAYALGSSGSDEPLDDFDSPAADIRTARMTLEVSDVPCGRGDMEDTIGVEIPFPPSIELESVQQALTGLGPVLVFVDHQPGDPAEVFHLAYVQKLFTPISSNGELQWEAMRNDFDDSWFKGGTSVEELQRSCPLAGS